MIDGLSAKTVVISSSRGRLVARKQNIFSGSENPEGGDSEAVDDEEDVGDEEGEGEEEDAEAENGVEKNGHDKNGNVSISSYYFVIISDS